MSKKAPTHIFSIGETVFASEKEFITAVVKVLKKTYKAKGFSFEENDIKGVIKQFVKGDGELDTESENYHENWGKIVAELKGYYAAAEQAAKEEVGKAAALEAAKAKEAEVKKNRELTVFNAAMNPAEVDRKLLAGQFVSGANFVDIKEGTTDEQLAAQFGLSCVLADFSPWAIGDLGAEMQKRGLDDVVSNFCAQTGRSESTIWGHIRLAKRVPKADRKPNILPSIYKELVFPTLSDDPKKDEKLKAKLIKEAGEKNFNKEEARAAANNAREVDPKKQGNQGAVKPKFITVDEAGNVVGYKEEQPFDEKLTQINLSKGEYLGLDTEEKLAWLPIEIAD